MKEKVFRRKVKLKVCCVLWFISGLLSIISSLLTDSILKHTLWGISAILICSAVVYGICYPPDYNFTIKYDFVNNHVIYLDPYGNCLVFIQDTLSITRKKKFLVLVDKFQKLKLPYSRDLENFFNEFLNS